MVAQQKHSIKKIVLEVNTNSLNIGYRLKDQLGMFLKEDILPYLERYFKSVEHQLPADIVQISQLNLEVDVNSHNNFETLKTNTKEKLVKEIDKLLKAPTQTKNLTLMDAQERQVISLLFFIEHGYAPWWKTSGEHTLFDIADFKPISSNRALQNQFIVLLKKNTAKTRCILQFTNKELQLLLKAVFKSQREAELLSNQVLDPIKQLNSKSRVFMWTVIMDYLSSKDQTVLIQKLHTQVVKETGAEGKNSVDFAEITVNILKQLLQTDEQNTISILQKPLNNPTLKTDTIISSMLSISSKIGLSEKALTIFKSVTFQKTHKKIRSKPFSDDDVIEDIISSEDKSHTSPDGYYVSNAGLVILHPYLVRFFQNCELLDSDNVFIDREMAVHALHYLATKKEQQLESNMVFEKFICGIPIEDSISRHVTLSDAIKNQAEALLKSVIENWDALGNASTDLLRYEFLQRQGKLSFKDNHPKITIERKTQDILVDKLPWGISLFKLPWLDTLIFTDW